MEKYVICCRATTLVGKKCLNFPSWGNDGYCWRHAPKFVQRQRERRERRATEQQEWIQQRRVRNQQEKEQKREQREQQERYRQEHREMIDATRTEKAISDAFRKYTLLFRQKIPNEYFPIDDLKEYERKRYSRRINELIKKDVPYEMLRDQLRRIRHRLYYEKHLTKELNLTIFTEKWIVEPSPEEIDFCRGGNNTPYEQYIDAQAIIIAVLDYQGRLMPIEDLKLKNIADKSLGKV